MSLFDHRDVGANVDELGSKAQDDGLRYARTDCLAIVGRDEGRGDGVARTRKGIPSLASLIYV